MRKKCLSIIILSLATLTLSGCSLVSEKAIQTNNGAVEKENITLKPISKDKMITEQMYVQDKDNYYPALINFNCNLQSSYPPDNSRVIFLDNNDMFIPTLYSDDKLIFNTLSDIPTFYEFERFEDEGYSIGLYNINVVAEYNKYMFENSSDNIVYNTDFVNMMANYEENTNFILHSINGQVLKSTDITKSKSIKNLDFGTEYEIEYFIGSQYHKDKTIADTHIYTSIEKYDSDIYKLTKNDVVEISVPKNLKNGYYLINGTFFIRYCNRKRSEGLKDVDFNENIENFGKKDEDNELEDITDIVIDKKDTEEEPEENKEKSENTETDNNNNNADKENSDNKTTKEKENNTNKENPEKN